MSIIGLLLLIFLYFIVDKLLKYNNIQKKNKIISLIHVLSVIATFYFGSEMSNIIDKIFILSNSYYLYDIYLLIVEEKSKINKYVFLFHHIISIYGVYLFKHLDMHEKYFIKYLTYIDIGAAVYYVTYLCQNYLSPKMKWVLLTVENIIYFYFRSYLFTCGMYKIYTENNLSTNFNILYNLSKSVLLLTYVFNAIIIKMYIQYTIKINLIFYIKQTSYLFLLIYILLLKKYMKVITSSKLLERMIDKLLFFVIKRSGCFVMKLVQWIVTRYDYISIDPENELNTFLENCPTHTFKCTTEIFKKNDINIYDMFDNVDQTPIASGTIGQVYKWKLKNEQNNDKYVAVKVRHPNIDIECWLPSILMKKYNYLINKIPYLYKYTLPFDLTNFFVTFETQLYFDKEGSNLDKFNELYVDNKYFIFPECIWCSKDILVMTYEDGEYFENLNISEYKKQKIALLYSLFISNGVSVERFVHGDLHPGNWKVRLNDDKYSYSLIIYDVGLCTHVKNTHAIDTMTIAKENDDFDLMIDTLISNCIKYPVLTENEKSILHKKTHEILLENNFIGENSNYDFVISLKLIIKIFAKKNIVIIDDLLNMILILSFGDNLYKKFDMINMNAEKFHKSFLINNLSLMQTYDIFPNLQTLYENKIDKYETSELFYDDDITNINNHR